MIKKERYEKKFSEAPSKWSIIKETNGPTLVRFSGKTFPQFMCDGKKIYFRNDNGPIDRGNASKKKTLVKGVVPKELQGALDKKYKKGIPAIVNQIAKENKIQRSYHARFMQR